MASRQTATGFFFMCACGCFVLAAVIAALVYTVIHGLWPAAIAVLLFSGLVGWLGRKMFVSERPRISTSQK